MADREYIIRSKAAGLDFSWSGSPRSHQINIRHMGGTGDHIDLMTMYQGEPATFAMFEECVNDWLKDHDYPTE